jgi:hypothetical protein
MLSNPVSRSKITGVNVAQGIGVAVRTSLLMQYAVNSGLFSVGSSHGVSCHPKMEKNESQASAFL